MTYLLISAIAPILITISQLWHWLQDRLNDQEWQTAMDNGEI